MHMDVGVAKNDILKPMHGRTKNNSIRKFQCPINGHTHIFTKNAETSGKCSTWAGMWFPLSKYPFKFKYVCQTKPSVTTGEPSNYQLANFRFGYGSKNWAITACHFTFCHVRTKRPKVKGKIQADLEPYPVTFQCPGCSNYFQITAQEGTQSGANARQCARFRRYWIFGDIALFGMSSFHAEIGAKITWTKILILLFFSGICFRTFFQICVFLGAKNVSLVFCKGRS